MTGCAALLLGSVAQADPIDYIFTGTCAASSCEFISSGTFFTSFTLTLVGDTSTVTESGGEYSNTVSSATFVTPTLTATFNGTNEVLDNTASPGYVGFAQLSTISVEATENSAFETYNLAIALGLTIGTPSAAPDTFDTSQGDLFLGDITALNFQAVVPSPVPAPIAGAGVPGMLFAGIGLLAWWRNRRRSANTGSAALEPA